nr:hypothetical protein [Mycolicibacterium sarraceniae]
MESASAKLGAANRASCASLALVHGLLSARLLHHPPGKTA